MVKSVRRVVTGHDENGKAVVIMDSHAENIVVSEHRPGGRTNLWRTDATPTTYDGDPDPAKAAFTTEPLANGVNFRINEFPPVSDAEISAYDADKAFGAAGSAHLVVKGARHPFMHRTETVDFAIVLEGEIDMLLDEEDVHLCAGDVVIQRGTNHAWANRYDKICRIAFVLIDAVDEDGRKRPHG
ncbi:MAG: cupin domain-containing protein [Alphaproteobacteria bacterium]|nr:cupin domain-containing protein [Alphaproteobacteria bacterium]